MGEIDRPRQGSLFLRKVPKMPEGYYSGDEPNPNLRAFVDAHLKERPYDPVTDNYDVPAFDKPIETTKATAIYNMHTYWSKKPHDAIRQYISHYTKPGDLVLDPFAGSGGTALAALLDGRKAVAIDRSPAATFITKNYCTPVDPQMLRAAFAQLAPLVGAELQWLYETRCDRCDGRATVVNTVYSQVFQCPRCLSMIPLFNCSEVSSQTAAGKPKKINVCPHCLEKGHYEHIRSQSKKFGSVPVQVSYACESGCNPVISERRHNDPDPRKQRYFRDYDQARIIEIENQDIPYPYPRGYSMTSFSRYQRDALYYYGVTEVADLFTKRTLRALASIFHAIRSLDLGDVRDMLLFSLTALLMRLSRMNQYRPDVSYPTSIITGTYYLPQVSIEAAVWPHLSNKVDRLCKGITEICEEMNSLPQLMISTQSATNLSNIPTNSVDYIFTDPPYAEKIQYGELNYAWEAWLGLNTEWHDDEIIVNNVRGKTEANWAEMMLLAMKECHRVLKPGRWMSLCYHDTSEGTWELIQDIAAEAGLLTSGSATTVSIDTGGKTFNQTQADKVIKRDLVIGLRKPTYPLTHLSTLEPPQDTGTYGFRETARIVIREYLQAHPGATKDRVFDDLVSRMIQSGQMEAHNFEEILREVADEVKEPRMKDLFTAEQPNFFGTHEVSRWYLRESEESVIDEAQSALEGAAAGVLRRYIEKQLNEHPHLEGIHYSDLFEQYVYGVKGKPRRQMADWLVDYFYKTEDGTWRPPASGEEERLKADGRASGTNRRIKQFAALLASGAPIPADRVPSPSTLADWIRQSKRTGMYDAGRLLYERGGLDLERLPDDLAADVEEDYQVCLRALQRVAGGAADGKRAKSRKGSQSARDRLI